jgi:Tol biopolymer transport system component
MNTTIMKVMGAGVLSALFMASVVVSAQQPEVETLLQTAHKKEVVDGDLPGAIETYKKALAAARGNRATEAMTRLRMADFYRRIGDNQSRKFYEEVLKDYPEQRAVVSLAKAALSENAPSSGMNSKVVWKHPDSASRIYAVSPDGRYQPFFTVDTKIGRLLMVHDFSTGIDRRIDASLPGDAAFKDIWSDTPAISKDGRQVVFIWEGSNSGGDKKIELRLASITGNAKTQRLYSFPSDITAAWSLDWASDGRTVAVGVQRKDGTKQLGLISTVDGAYQVLKSLKWRPLPSAVFSPDGRWLGFDDQDPAGTNFDVFILAVDGSREIPAVKHRANDEIIGWSPDGKWLLFSSDRNGATELFGSPFDGASVGSARVLKSGFEGAYPLGVTRSGTLYYEQEYPGAARRVGLASFDIHTGKIAPMEFPQTTRHSNDSPRWSPDGKYLAYRSRRADGRALVIRSTDTGQSRELRPDVDIQNLYDWSPDGNWLAVTGRDSTGRYGIHLVNPQSGQVQPLAPGAGGGPGVDISWTPDSRALWFTSEGSLNRVDVASGDVSRLLQFPAGSINRTGAISPDGKRMYRLRFARADKGVVIEKSALVELDLSSGIEKELRTEIAGRSLSLVFPFANLDGHVLVNGFETLDGRGTRVLRLISTTGGEPRDLMRLPLRMPDGSDVSPIMLPLRLVSEGGSVLVAVTTVTGGGGRETAIWLVPLSGGEPRKISDSGEVFPADGMTLSPDGRHLAYTIAEKEGLFTDGWTHEIWALENFLPGTAAK